MNESRDQSVAAVPTWNVETLRAHVDSLMVEMDKRLTERHQASDKAIQIAFEAQNTAMQAAFVAQKEAVMTAFLSQKESVAAALAAADRAVLKAELSTEKRFESVNEFRSTLADQQRMLMPRSEVEAIIKGLEARLDSNTKVLTDKIETNAQAISAFTTDQRLQGSRATGVQFGWQYSIAIIGFILSVLGILSWFAGKPPILK